MKKAATIIEMARNFNPNYILKLDDENVYIPIYEEILATLRDKIIYDELESQTLFVAGQSGTGKTTALNFLPGDEIDGSYNTKYINGRDLFDPNDIDIIDILLMFSFKIVQGTKLQEQYFEELEKLQKVKDGVLTEERLDEKSRKASTGAKAEAGVKGGFFDFIKAGVTFFTSYNFEASYRNKAREIFKLKKPELLRKVNELIKKYYELEESKGKKLLVVFDDLDKLRNVEQIRSVFIENRFYLTQIECKKVIAIPIHITADYEVLNFADTIPKFGIRLDSNPLDRKEGKKESDILKKQKKQLHRVIGNRIEKKENLIDEDAIDEAVKFSGGILRQFVNIIYGATVRARRLKAEKISKSDIYESWQQIKDLLAPTIITTDKIKFLDGIMKNKVPVNNDSPIFIELLLGNQIIACFNGIPWYDVNPVIEKTVRIYAERQDG